MQTLKLKSVSSDNTDPLIPYAEILHSEPYDKPL